MKKAKTKIDYSKHKLLHTFTATLFCWGCIFLAGPLFSFLLHPVEKFNPLSRWQDVELSDLYFAYFSASNGNDKNIVIMDCSSLNRDGIASQIEQAIDSGASVVGVDAQFDIDGDSIGTARLKRNLIRYSSKVVLALDHTDSETNKMNYPFYLDLMTEDNPRPNFGYMLLTDQFKVLRDFTPVIKSNSPEEADTSFPVKIMKVSGNAGMLEKLYDRRKKREIVHYRKLYAYDNSVLCRYKIISPGDTIEAGSLKGKIILIGDYNSRSFEDNHFSPLNENLDRSLPDMKGVEYHAQVLSMINNGDYINTLWFKKCWIFLFCGIGVFFFLKIFHHPLFHIYLDIIVLTVSPVIMFISILLLKYSSLKLEPADFIIPLFLSGIFLHLYDWLLKRKFVQVRITKIKR